MNIYRFYKDEEGWFIDLPEWTGSKSDLAMVLGADTMLDIISENGNEVHITIELIEFEDSELLKLTRLDDEIGGGYYHLDKIAGLNVDFEIWLCSVTRFVFNGEMPDEIYIRKEY